MFTNDDDDNVDDYVDEENFEFLPLDFNETYKTLKEKIKEDAAREIYGWKHRGRGKRPSAIAHAYVGSNFINYLSKLDDRILNQKDKSKRDKLIDYRINLSKMWKKIYIRLNKELNFPFTSKNGVEYRIKEKIVGKLKRVLM